MKKEIVLPSLFVLNAFLVGMMPKTSKAGSVVETNTPGIDTVRYRVNLDTSYWKPQPIDFFESRADSAKKDTLSYNISWQGREWVKYTSEDGSGFIRSGGSRTWRNMNPGALRHGDFARQYGACGSAGGFAVFPSEEHGMNALRGLLKSEKYANLTIAAAIRKYAPPSDNNDTRGYQRRLSALTGLNLTQRIKSLSPEELNRVANAIRTLEGWKSGKDEPLNIRNNPSGLPSDLATVIRARAIADRQRS